jgi:hypothetical protein
MKETFVSNRYMTASLRLPLALMCLAGLWGCAAVSSDDPTTTTTMERNRGNGTVRAAVYVEAASNVAAPSPTVGSETASAMKSTATRGKQDKRPTQASKNNKRTTATVAPTKQVAAASDASARSIDQKVPVSASGYRYTYSVELDAGGTKTFGFATDQGLLVGDRVTVSDTGVALIPK